MFGKLIAWGGEGKLWEFLVFAHIFEFVLYFTVAKENISNTLKYICECGENTLVFLWVGKSQNVTDWVWNVEQQERWYIFFEEGNENIASKKYHWIKEP